MSNLKPWLWLASVFACTLFSTPALALGEPSYLSERPSDSTFNLVDGNHTATLYHSESADTAIQFALKDLQRDIERVTGKQPRITSKTDALSEFSLIVGEIGKHPLIDELIAQGKLTVDEIAGQWEGYLIQVLDQPFAGVKKALVVAGTDRRGAAYGLYDISEQIGVSPWYWWADVPVKRRDGLYIRSNTRVVDAPKIKYRGIFLNDEAPALTGWVHENYGNYNSEFYAKVFELLMRLKANYLWPAMWNNAFADDDPHNMVLAHQRGIVMGTSHHEPMMRADKEWNRYGEGPWDYERNPEKLYEFWEAGARRNKPYDSIYTMGMRGQADTPMSDEQNIGLLEKIVADQRGILDKVFERDLTDVPQVWALYKEVQGYYESGMRVPDDVTLLWADDNWGNIRRLPTPQERDREGGAGVYYHFDYVGGPRSYRWMNVTPIAKVWEQMNLAYAYDAKRIWIVNVGDLKPQEFPTEFFLRLAWDPEDWPKERLQEFGRLWATREFGPEHAAEIERLITGYTRHNGRRKPELMSPDTYSQLNYNEADRVSAELAELLDSAEALYNIMDLRQRDAFFQLVLHPVKATYLINELYNATAKNRLYAHQGRASAGDYAERAEAMFAADQALTDQYHSLNNGKWNHFMAQTRIGYTHWNNPPANTMPVTYQYRPHARADMGVAVEGDPLPWPYDGSQLSLPSFSPYGPTRHYIDIFNRGTEPFAFTATPSDEWISVDKTEGTVELGERLYVSIDWDKMPAGKLNGSVFIKGTGWGGASVKVQAHLPGDDTRERIRGFVEHDGHLSIQAAHYSRQQTAGDLAWEKIEQHGHTDASISVFPVTDKSFLELAEAPWVEYDVYLFSSGEVTVKGLFAPSLNFVPGRGLRYAIAFNNEPPQIIDLLADNSHGAWQEAVRKGVRETQSTHTIDEPGQHKLRIYAVDPGVTLQKLIIDTGGLRPSYLGPPESQHR